jgi:5'-phosphate synthase pdxT subunit
MLRIGVLALQGDFEAHRRMLAGLGAEAIEARTANQLRDLDGLVIPGGESTTIAKGIARDGLEEPILRHARDGRPILGSCAGMIVCDRDHLGIGDYSCRRNAFGRQLHSFEQDLAVEGAGPDPLRAVFIRAPWVEEHGAGVEVLAEVDDHPVALRDGQLLAVAFHPELTDDSRVHAMFMAIASPTRSSSASPSTRTSSASPPGVRGEGADGVATLGGEG